MRFNLIKMIRGAVPLAVLLLSACSPVPATTTTTGFSIGGAISGLTGTVVLQNNSGDNLSITGSGYFVFATKVKDSSAYRVSVLTQPAGQICSVSAGAGTVTGINVNSVVVTCSSSSYTVGGSVTGLVSNSVVLQNNGSDNLTVAANGTFSFATKVADGSAYNVSILTQPADRRCSVRNSSGTIAGGNISNVNVVCGKTPLSLGPTVSTFAGVAGNFADGTGAAARFSSPNGSVSDGTNLYVADYSNNAIRKIVIATGVVTTLAGSPTGLSGAADGTGTAATFYTPDGITLNGGNLYVTDMSNHKIRQIVIATGVVSSFTGTPNTAGVPGAVDGAANTATFWSPKGITTDGTNLYVADSSNEKIRQIVIATGVVSSLTGTPNTAMATGAADDAVSGATARFCFPTGITTDFTNLYVADQSNFKIRQIVIATGVVSSLTGPPNVSGTQGAADGAGTAARFNYPQGITTDFTNLYVADQSNLKIRQIVILTGVVTSLTGTASTASVAGKTNGVPASATFSAPNGVSYDLLSNSLFVTDSSSNDLRQITLGGSSTVSTLAGVLGPDGTGAAATFNYPYGTATDGTNLYVTDGSHTIRQIVIATGAVTTLAGQNGVPGAADGTGTAATFNNPTAITTDGTNLYVADTNNRKIRQIVISTGVVSSLTGTANTQMGLGAVDGAVAIAGFSSLKGITSDGTNLYVADSGNNKIRQIVISAGVVSSLTGTTNTAMGTGAVDGAGTAATFSGPVGITTDGTNLYVADQGNQKIRQIVIATGAVSSLTGTANTTMGIGNADGAGTAATFTAPTDLTSDGTNLYVVDSMNNKIRQIVIATGVVSSLTGTANTAMGTGAVDGAGTAATFSTPTGITTDGSSLYVTDKFNSTIRKIQ